MTIVIETHARATDPETSHKAARKTKIKLIKANAYLLIDEAGVYGLTGKQLNRQYSERFNDADYDTPRKRISDLVADGLVVDSGQRRDGQRVMITRLMAEAMGLAA